MANVLYDYARELFLSGSLSWTSGSVKAYLVDSPGYSPQPQNGTHKFLSDVPISARVSGPKELEERSALNGAADAKDVTFNSVSGAQLEYIIIYKDTGDPATSPLIALIDTANGLPITPNGGDIIVTWDNGSNKIFKL